MQWKFWRKLKSEAEIGEHYMVEDVILPQLTLPNPCSIRISITEDFVALYVGQRDWSWTRGCPDINSCGTMLDTPMPDEDQAQLKREPKQ